MDDDCEIAVFLTDSFLKSLRLLTKAKTLLYLLIYIVEIEVLRYENNCSGYL